MANRRVSLPVLRNYSPNRLSPGNVGYLKDIREFDIQPPFLPSSPSTSNDTSPKMLSPLRPASARPYRRRRKLTADHWPANEDDHFDDFFESSASPSPRKYSANLDYARNGSQSPLTNGYTNGYAALTNNNNNYNNNSLAELVYGGAPPLQRHHNAHAAARPAHSQSGLNSSCSTYPSSEGPTEDAPDEEERELTELQHLQRRIAEKAGKMRRFQQMRSFNVDTQGKIVDCGFKNSRPSRPLSRGNKNRRATCPEIWLSSADDDVRETTECSLRVYGAPNVGKRTIVRRMGAHADIKACVDLESLDTDEASPACTINFMLNESEVQLEIAEGDLRQPLPADEERLIIHMVVYSIDDRDSFIRAAQLLYRLQDMKPRGTRLAAILVANKVDLQRNRKVSFIEGKMLAKIYKSAFVEISALLTMNMDQFWEGTLRKLQKAKTLLERKQNLETKRSAPTAKFMGRIFKQGRRFAKSCEEIVARLALR